MDKTEQWQAFGGGYECVIVLDTLFEQSLGDLPYPPLHSPG